MLIAYNNSGERIMPTYSGQKAICPLCNGILIGHCGEIYAKHWQHHRDRMCDPWKEHETEWHRNWKSLFPEDWREIVIENNGEKHIADIKTAKGVVIEFQNSSISSSTIRIREDFYEDMIWVVNAITFKGNFKISSSVKSNLRRIEANTSNDLFHLEEAFKKDLKEIEDKIEKYKRQIEDVVSSIEYKTGKAEKLKEILANKDTFADTIIDKWCTGGNYYNIETNNIINNINADLKKQLQELYQKIQKTQDEIRANEEKLTAIDKLENISLHEKPFKIVSYEQIPLNGYSMARAISKSSRTTFFPDVIEFRSEAEFQSYKYKKHNFDFAFDVTNTINTHAQKNQDAKNALSLLEMQISQFKILIADQIIQELKNKIQEHEIENEKLRQEQNELEYKHSRLIERKDTSITELEKEYNAEKLEIEKKAKSNRIKIMFEKKGLFTYDWKHERKSWKAANTLIYFDTGEPYLFERLKEGVFRKISKPEFIKHHLAGQLNTPG